MPTRRRSSWLGLMSSPHSDGVMQKLRRSDAAVWRLNDHLVGQPPVVNSNHVAHLLGISEVSAPSAIDHLVKTGTLTEITKRVRGRVWQARDVVARLDEFAANLRRTPA